MARGPRCFRCLMLMLSSPVELLFLTDLMAWVVCCGVMMIGVWGSFFGCLLIFLFVHLVACFTNLQIVFTNWLLKALAFSWGVRAGLLLKLMILFVCSGVFFLWSQFCSSLFFHRLVLWSLICFEMLSFMSFRFGSVGFVLRRLFLHLIRSLIWVGLWFDSKALELHRVRDIWTDDC